MHIQKIVKLCIFIFTCSTVACVSDSKEAELIKEIERLNEKIVDRDNFIEDLQDEIGGINDLFDSIEIAQLIIDINQDDVNFNVEDKIIFMDSLIVQSESRINELEKQIEAYSPSRRETKLLTETIRNLKNTLSSSETLIENLKQEIQQRDIVIQSQQSRLNVVNNELIATTQDLSRANDRTEYLQEQNEILDTENEGLKDHSQKLAYDLTTEKKEAKYKISKIESATEQYEKGVEYLSEYERIKKKLGKKREKRELINNAYQKFKSAKSLGHPKADNKLSYILNKPKYRKHVIITP